jgi:hypothetical protein
MKLKEVRSVIDIIHDTSAADLVIVSVLLLPILLGSWLILINSIAYFDQHDDLKLGVIFVIAIIYVLGLIIMKWWDPPEEKLKRAKLHVKNRLEQRKGNRASYRAIREEVNEGYTDDFLKKLIDRNPETFRTVQVKRGGKYLPGITLVEDELENVESTV